MRVWPFCSLGLWEEPFSGVSPAPPQYAVETPGVTIMRQTNRCFFCGHTSGKVSGQAPFLPPGALFHQTGDWALSFTRFWRCSWGAGGVN